MKTHRGTTYWPTYQAAMAWAHAHGYDVQHPGTREPIRVPRLVEYERGWAIQTRIAGLYVNADSPPIVAVDV